VQVCAVPVGPVVPLVDPGPLDPAEPETPDDVPVPELTPWPPPEGDAPAIGEPEDEEPPIGDPADAAAPPGVAEVPPEPAPAALPLRTPPAAVPLDPTAPGSPTASTPELPLEDGTALQMTRAASRATPIEADARWAAEAFLNQIRNCRNGVMAGLPRGISCRPLPDGEEAARQNGLCLRSPA
jgi:hypothetical protein